MAERACSLSGLANVVRTLWAKSSADGADIPLPICASRIQALITLAGGSYSPRSYRLNWDCETPRTVANSAWVRPLRATRMRSATLLTIGYLGGVSMLSKHHISSLMLIKHFFIEDIRASGSRSSRKSGVKRINSSTQVHRCDLRSLMSQFTADRLSRNLVLALLCRCQLLCRRTACRRSLPACQHQIARLGIAMPQTVHVAQARCLALPVVDMPLLDVGLVPGDQRAQTCQTVCFVQHCTLFRHR